MRRKPKTAKKSSQLDRLTRGMAEEKKALVLRLPYSVYRRLEASCRAKGLRITPVLVKLIEDSLD